MLSRVAERVYWMSRYLERAENTARLVDSFGMLLLDLPPEADVGWEKVFQILGLEDVYEELGGHHEEAAAVTILVGDGSRPYSLAAALANARENARTTRDIVPTEAWRTINELHLYAGARLRSEAARGDALREIVDRCHQVCGILEGTMSHGPAYQFVRIGRNLERADMISRMIDVAAAVLMAGRDEIRPFDDALWGVALRSLSAYQMYRQYVRRSVRGESVIPFLLQDRDFPRSIVHCCTRMSHALSTLPRGEAACNRLEAFAARVQALDPSTIGTAELRSEMDLFQTELAGLHDVIRETWLSPGSAA
jgi:uncharacterized alpha-E superfamily protein